MLNQYDVIVIGSGIAGLSFARDVAKEGFRVAILTKKDRAESNTNYAQGGIASVTSDSDDFESHVKDTLEAGAGLCKESVVRAIIADGPDRIQDLVESGVDFSKLSDGRVSLGKEGGHSKRRVLHVKDTTGNAIETALLETVAGSDPVDLFEHFFVMDLITSYKIAKKNGEVPSGENKVLGLYALNVMTGEVEVIRARVVMLASGGAGQVYQFTTNPDIATGDGIAMAYRAGAKVMNMEFIQFHPTTLYGPDNKRFLITEAVRGEGGVLRNHEKKRFMPDYDERSDLAPRDVVARAIDQEMKKSGAHHMWLDITKHTKEMLMDRFPNIYQHCMKQEIDISCDYIPVVPAAHYLCGGVKTDIDAQTSLPGLFACGEAACTGLHGANRLASNSLLEAVVLAQKGAVSVIQYLKKNASGNVELPVWKEGDTANSDERVVLSHNWDELQRTMWDYVGIVRSSKRLKRAKTRIQNLSKEIDDYYWHCKVDPELLELRNLILVADLIIDCAMKRKESRGLHFTLDYLERSEISENSVVQREFNGFSSEAS